MRLASLTTGSPGIAVPPGLANSPLGENKCKCSNNDDTNLKNTNRSITLFDHSNNDDTSLKHINRSIATLDK